ncbi:peptidylprolyl isomerase [Dechloromonas sp. XY25]|uniref:peptidylprolyl isomerase n=1 Tax=Dechloromonas hankyongensis TaxID=2908002 RepID=A0ABS9K1U7_9RHOO|nr:peptidyl-prolyl cis-trans isomerase [Dechloromonas hankyongensis]MCG2577162.1 peptidylprolyl isomerase [Dechloromonas hankyongensis]
MKTTSRASVCHVLALMAGLSGLPLAWAQAATNPAATPEVEQTKPVAAKDLHDRVFAVINGRAIPTSDYEGAFTALIRQRFYHGQIPENELAGVREEIKSKLVQRVVLLEEAERRNITPEQAQIDEVLAGYEKRYTNSPQWQQNREMLLPGLIKQLSEQSLIAQLDKQVRDVPQPSDAEVRAFYDKNRNLFTEPEKIRLAVILLAVDPSSPATAWQATRDEARAIYARLQNGADFEEAARLHSSVYAEKSGDMGYLHRGMLPENIQSKVDQFELNKVNEPIDTLEGVAIFRLVDRLAATPRDFADVATRARDLLVRERQDAAWKELIDRLVAKADVKFMHAVSTEQREGAKK